MRTLERFKSAQDSAYGGFESALREINAGGKHGHWIWYVFPQLAGLGISADSQFFGIDDEEEAVAFLRDSELRSRFMTITAAVLAQLEAAGAPSLGRLMGSDIDARKLVSSLTLFENVAAKLAAADNSGEYNSIAKVAEAVLAVAASQGYPRCAFTLRRLQGIE